MFILLITAFRSVFAADYYYTYYHNCGAGPLSAAKILQFGVDAGIMVSGHATGGSWDDVDGLTQTGIEENAEFTGFVVGNTYDLLWNKNNNHFYYIQVEVQVANQPIVDFYASNPTPCGTSYLAEVILEISGGVSDYSYTIERLPEADFSSTTSGNTTLGFGNQTVDRTYTLTAVEDANGCIPSGLPMSASFTMTSPPTAVDVSGNSNCTPNSITISIPSPEAGVTYYLAESGVKVVGSEISSAPYTWTTSDVGSYEIYAENPCDATSPILMNGGPFILAPPPTASAISILGGGPYCAGNNYTVEVANSELGVTYSLYNPSGVLVESVTSIAAGALNIGPNVLTLSGDYSVTASVGSCGPIAMSNVVTLGAEPFQHTILSTTVCEGTNLTVHMQTSTAGITYELMYDDGTGAVSIQSIVSAGGGFDFAAENGVGTYYVEAQDALGCTATMNGTATINALPSDYSLNYTGSICPSGIVSVGSAGTPVESDVTYYLFKDGISTGVSRLGSTAVGGVISFGDQSVAGVYTIRAVRGSCSVDMSGSLVVYEDPDILTLTYNKNKYCATEPLSGVTITISNIEANVDYLLQQSTDGGVNWTSLTTKNGSAGSDLSWINRTQGIFRVIASNPGGCSVEMGNRITIAEVTEPDVTSITVDGSNRRCEDASTTFTLRIELTGNPPYNFDIVDDKGNTIASLTGINNNTYTYSVDPNDAQTLYSVANLTDVASCSAVNPIATTTIYVDPIPVITFTPEDPEVCIGSSVTISADGAGVGGSYVWSDGLGANQTINIAPSVTDTYTVTATTTRGCTASDDITVTVHPLPTLSFDTPGSVYEYCENDGVIPLNGNQSGASFSGAGVPTGGSVFYTDPNTTNADIVTAASYGANEITYNYTDGNGCTNTLTKEITVNSLPTVVINNLDDTYCSDAGDVTFYGTPDGSAVGSTGTFTIVGYEAQQGTWWDEGSPSGTGTFNVGDALNTIGPKTIIIRYTYTDPETCTAYVEQAVELLPDYNTNLSFTGLPSDACETSASVTLTPYLAGVLLTPADGTISFSGPAGSLTDNGDGTFDFDPSVAGAGVHTITLNYTDLNNCSGSVSESIEIGTPLNMVGFSTEYCSSDSNPYTLTGQIDGAAPPAPDLTTFTVYAPDGSVVALNQPNGTYDFIPSTLFGNHEGGLYKVVYTYDDLVNGCTNTLTTDVYIIEELDATFTIGGDPYATAQQNYCEGDSPVELKGSADLVNNAIGIVASTFTGNGSSGNGISGGYFNPSDGSVNYHPTANTIYHTVIHTVNGKSCPSPVESFDVYVNQVDVGISNLKPSREYCTNDGTFDISVNGTDATFGTAVFSATKNGSTTTSFLTDNNDNTATIDPSVGPGTYEITMDFTKTVDGCVKTVVESIEVYAANPVTFSGVTDGQDICISSAPITLRGDMFVGGAGNFTISPVVAGGIENAGTDDLGNAIVADDGVANFVPAALNIGPYTITYTFVNAAGCETTAQKTVNIVSAPTQIYDITVSDKNDNPYGAYCDDDVAPDRGVRIGLSGSNTGVEYELLLGGISITPTSVTFLGNGSSFFFQDGSGNDLRFTEEGIYTVRAVQNACDALMNGSVSVEQYELVLEEESKSNITCNGLSNGIIELKASGGSGSYQYSIDGGTNWQASETFTGLGVGDHTFSVKDLSSAGCNGIDVLTVTISQPTAILIIEDATQNTNVGCLPCTAGVDCEGSATISISGGSPDNAKYPATGGYGISWSTGGTDFTETLMPESTPYHSVTVTDGNNCIESLNIDIDVNPTLQLAEDVDPLLHIDNVCNGESDGSYVVTATGGSGTYQFSLSDPGITTPTWLESNYGAGGNQYRVSGLSLGTYDIWVRDRNVNYNRCYTKVDVPIEITEPTALSIIEESKSEITCNGASDGSFIVRASGGLSGTYQFSETDPALGAAVWEEANDGVDGYEVTGLSDGTYTIWMRDKVNTSCDVVDVSVTLSDILPLSYTLVEHTNVLCYSDNTGRLQVTAQGGSGNYVYQWEDAFGIISTDTYAEDLVAGNYTLTITDVDADPANCTPFTEVFTITQPANPLEINELSTKDNDCSATSNGAIQIDITGGTAPYNIIWSNGVSNTESLSGLSPGNYTVTVEDDNGCIVDNSVTPIIVGEQPDITMVPASLDLVNNDCYLDNSGSIEFQVTGGSGFYMFRLQGDEIRDWTVPVPTNSDTYIFENLYAGTYEVLVRDANNSSCEYSLGSYNITQPNELLISNDPVVGLHNVSCYGGNDGWFTITATGGSGDYDYSIDNGANWTNFSQINTFTFSNLVNGTYLVKVRDFNEPSCVSSTLQVDVNQAAKIQAAVISVTNTSCFNTSDGVVTVTANGGSGTYDYYCVETSTWDDDGIFNLPKGTYTFIAQDEDVVGCVSDATAQITVDGPLDFTTTVTSYSNITCNGDSDGEIYLSTQFSNSASGLFEYSVDNGVTYQSSPITGLGAGVYVVMIRDANHPSCENTLPTTVTLTEPDPLTHVLDGITDVQCYGDDNGAIQISVSGGTPNYSYQWTGVSDANGGKTDNPTSLTVGTYSVSIMDDHGCSILPLPSYIVTEPDELEAEYQVVHVELGGQSTGSIAISNITGGPTTNYDVLWDDGSTSMSRTNLAAGTYTFTVYSRDNLGNILCERIYDIDVIDESLPLDFDLVTVDAECYGSDGNIELTIKSGNSPYDITWSKAGTVVGNTSTGDIITNIPVPFGVYEINVTDASTASITKTATINQPDDFSINAYVNTDKVCEGDLAEVVVDISGDAWDNAVAPQGDNFNVSWIDPDGLTIANGTFTNEAVQSNQVKSGNYTVYIYEISNPTCIKSQTITVSDPQPLGIVETIVPVKCYNGTSGSISVVPTGRPAGHGFTYSWEQFDGTSWILLTGETASSITNKPAGIYRVTIQSVSTVCNYTSGSLEISQPDEVSASVTHDDIITCFGDPSGNINLTNIRGGTEPYKYTINGVDQLLPIGTTNYNLGTLTSQNYTIVLTDVNGCLSPTYSVDILEPEELTLDITTANIDCQTINTGVIELAIGGGRILSGEQQYLVTVSPDGKSDIILNQIPNATGVQIPVSDPLLTGLVANKYVVKVIDLNSDAVDKCIISEEVNLEHVLATADVSNATCMGVSNGSILNVQITGTTNYNFTWSTLDGTGIDNTNLAQSGLSKGTYTLSIEDLDRAGCTADFDFVVDYDNTISITADIVDVICSDEETGAINLSTVGTGSGTTYSWSGPSGYTFVDNTLENQSALPQGNYTVTIETTLDGQQCLASKTFTVTEPDEITYNAYFEYTDCDPYQRTLVVDNVSGGTGTYDYSWNGPAFSPAIPTDPTNVLITQGGTYTITVSDVNLCEVSKDVVVPNEITIDYDQTDVTCYNGYNGSINISNIYGGSGSYSYSWTGPVTYTAITRNIDHLRVGTYVLTITDNNENVGGSYCSRSFTFTVTEPNEIEINPTVKDVSCFGRSDGQIEIGVLGGSGGYSYEWSPVVSPNLSSNKNQYDLPADDYTITVTDDSLCTATITIPVLQDTKIQLSAVVTDTQCDGTNGEIDLTVSGGSGDVDKYEYDWSSLDGSGLNTTGIDQTGLSGGTFSVIVTDTLDGRSCIAQLSKTLTHELETVDEVVTPVTCSGNDDGSISFNVTGGTGNYSYQWSVVAGSGANPLGLVVSEKNQSGLSEGQYQVVITDERADGTICSITRVYEITASTWLDVSVAEYESNMCYGAATGKLVASVVGGSGSYSYEWNGPDGFTDTNSTIENLVQGSYELKVTDDVLGCTFIKTYEINGPLAPLSVDNVIVTPVLCYGDQTGEINVVVSGGTPPYIYQWNGPGTATGSNPTGLIAGSYDLKIIDDNQCELDYTGIEITQPGTHVKLTNPVIVNASDVGEIDGQITVDVSGGVAPYSFQWYDSSNNAVGIDDRVLSGVGADTYRVVVTDNNGCTYELAGLTISEPGTSLGFYTTVHQVSPCNGSANGEIHITNIYGGTPLSTNNYNIQITGPNTNVNEDNTSYDLVDLEPGDYYIVVTDDAGVFVERTITIEEPDPLNIVATKVLDVSCFGDYSGEISVTVSGGKPSSSGYYYVRLVSDELGEVAQKTDAQEGVSFSFANIPAGNYRIIATDHASDFDTHDVNQGNCEYVETNLLITQPEAKVGVRAVSVDNTICNGDSYDLEIYTTDWDFNDGDLRVSVSDGFNISSYDIDQTPYILTVNPTTTSTYKVTQVNTTSGAICLQGEPVGDPVTVVVNALPTATITGPTEVCEDGTVVLTGNLTGSAPFDITWRDELNGTSDTKSITGYSYSFNDSPVSDARYRILTVSDNNGCLNNGDGIVDVSINNKPKVSLSGGTDICEGESTNLQIGLVDGEAPFVVTYTANGIEGTLVINDAAPSSYTWSVSPTVTTVYEITNVFDGNNCLMDIGASIMATVNVNVLPDDVEEIFSTTDMGSVCQGAINIDYYVDPVTNADSYQWTVDPGINIISGGITNILVDFDRSFTGGYIRVYAENGCGTSRVVERWINASVLPDEINVAPTGDTDICEGESGLVYSINPVANASSYEWDIPTGFIVVGDDSGPTIVVDIDPNVVSTTDVIRVRPINSCSSNEPWSPALTINITPLPNAYAGLDERICGTTYTLNADALNSGESGQWEIIKGSGQYTNAAIDQISSSASIYNLSQGENIFVWTVRNNTTGCSTSDTVSIFNDQVTVSAGAESYSLCDGQVELFATPLESVDDADIATWSVVPNTGSFADASDPNATVSNLARGTSTLTWTIQKGACFSSVSFDVVNNEPSETEIYNSANVKISELDLPCGDNFTSLSGNIPEVDETGYWIVESGSVDIDNINSATINLTNIAEGDNVLSWNILKGSCISSTFVEIRNNYFTVDAGIDRVTCDGTMNLSGSELTDGATGIWTVDEGSGDFEDALSASTSVSGLSQDNSGRNVFRWTVSRNGCSSYDETVITNDQPSEALMQGDVISDHVCGEEYTLNAVEPVYGSGLWTVVSGSGSFEDPQLFNTNVSNVGIGDNVYRWTVYNNTCSSSIDFELRNLHIEVYAGADTAVCGRVAQLNATPVPDGATGEWNGVGGSTQVVFNPSNTQADASATSLGYGTNALVWTVTKDGCVSTDTVIISNNAPYEVSASTYIYTDGNKTTLRAEIPDVGSGIWTLVEGRGDIANPTSATTEVTNLLPNYNYFRWTVTNVECSDYVDVAVQSGVLAEAEAGSDQYHLCEDYTTLNANEPEGTYGEWTIVEGSADFESSNSAKTKVTNIRSGQNIFRWTLRFAGGSENYTTDTVIIVNNKPTDADAGLDIYECGDVATLNAREPVVGTPLWSVLSGGGVFSDDTNPKTDVSELAKGENVFKYQIQKDICFSYDTISVYNYESSDAYGGDSLRVVCQDSALLNPEIPKYGEGTWRVIEGAGKGRDEDGNETDEIVGYVYDLAPGVNRLVWEVKVPEASSDCVKRDTITIINNEPSEAFAGHDRPVCVDTVALSGSVPVYGVGTWTLLSGSGNIVDSSQTNTIVTNLAVGQNRFRWTIDNNGCTSYSDVEISNDYIQAFAGYDQPINCADTAVLEANNPLPGIGTWGIEGGSGSANFDDNESPYSVVRNLDKGDNILTWTINYKQCRSVSQVTITNNEPSQAIAGDNKATCEDYFVLGAADPEVGVGRWTIKSGGGDFVDENNNSTRVNNLKFGTNVFRWTVENNGCELHDDVAISFNRIDAEVGGTQEICADHTFLEANNPSPGLGTWTVVGGSSQARFVDTHDANTEVMDLAKGSNLLRWSINNEGCVTSSEVTVINHTPSTAYAGGAQEICESLTVLDATAVEIGTGSWEVLIGSGTISSDQINNPKANISGLSKGENVLRWTVTSDNGLCSSEDDVIITNNEPSEPYAGASQEYCSPTVQLKAAIPDFGTGLWSIIDGGGNFDDATLHNATISNLNEGLNILRWTISQGQCFKSSDIEVLNNTPTTASAGPDIEDCKDYADLDANVPSQGEGYWTLISGNASFVDETDAKTRVEELTFGENILMWNVQKGGCISSDQITIFNQIPDQAEAGTNRSTCEDYLTLNANNPDTGIGTWTIISGNGEFDDPNSPTTIVRELGLGENRFKWTVAYGECTTEDVVEVVSNKTDPYAGEDAIVYDPEFELKASNPGDLGATWSIVAGTGDFDDNTYFNTTVRNLSEGVNTYRWLMNVNGCITYDDVSIEYRVVPDAAFVVDTTQGCYPLSIQFTNYSDGGSSFLWEFGDGYTSTDRNPVHTFDDPGVYTVTMTAPGPDGVNGVYTKDITVYDHPVAEFSYGPDIVYVPGDLLRCYSLSVDADTYLWEFGDGNTSTDVNPLHEYLTEGVFDISLTVESQYGCIDEIIKTNAVTAVLQGFVKFPTAFMPRPDGGTVNTIGGGETNTIFRPVYRDVDQYKLQIFNRWGQLIYEGTDIDEGWNGFYNNELSPQGVYVWKATGTFISGKVFTEAGSVLLVR